VLSRTRDSVMMGSSMFCIGGICNNRSSLTYSTALFTFKDVAANFVLHTSNQYSFMKILLVII
jgi:hypothetical protein